MSVDYETFSSEELNEIREGLSRKFVYIQSAGHLEADVDFYARANKIKDELMLRINAIEDVLHRRKLLEFGEKFDEIEKELGLNESV